MERALRPGTIRIKDRAGNFYPVEYPSMDSQNPECSKAVNCFAAASSSKVLVYCSGHAFVAFGAVNGRIRRPDGRNFAWTRGCARRPQSIRGKLGEEASKCFERYSVPVSSDTLIPTFQ